MNDGMALGTCDLAPPHKERLVRLISGDQVPRLPGRIVRRERLLRRLDRLAPVTVLQALPGSGKTTIVAHWVRDRALDQDTAWFLVRPGEESVAALTAALGEVLGRPGLTVVVLDDTHHLSRSASEVVADLVALHPSVHVVACTDGRDYLAECARQRKMSVQVIPGAEMFLTPQELPAWAATWGHALTPAQSVELHSLVGGWIEPLQRVLDATPSWAERYVTEPARRYVARHVLPLFADLPLLDDARRLAIGACVNVMTAAMLLGAQPSTFPPRAVDVELAERRIRLLERAGLLWPEGGGTAPSWRYPTLVRRTLSNDYHSEHPERARADHGTTAATLRALGRADLMGAVMLHARRGEDWQMLSRIWFEESWRLIDLAADDFGKAYRDLPAAVLRTRPDLQLPGSLADIVVRSEDEPYQRARFIMRHYMQVGLDYLSAQSEAANPVDRIERLIAAMVALRHDGKINDALVLGPRIDRELAGLRRREEWGRRSIPTSRFLLEWGVTNLLACDCSTGNALLARAYETNPTGLTGSRASGLLSLFHAMLGNAGESRRWLDRHERIGLAGWWTRSRAMTPARLARASIALDQLDVVSAAYELGDAEPWGDDAGELWPFHLRLSTRLALLRGEPSEMLCRLFTVAELRCAELAHGQNAAARELLDRCRAELMLAGGEVDRVRQLLESASDRTGWQRPVGARLLLMTGDAAAAQRTASAAAWADTSTPRDRAELLMIASVAALRRGRESEAGATFRRAHAACGQAEMRDPYLTCPPDELRLLLGLAGVTLSGEATEAIGASRLPYPTTVTAVNLSPRESEVLQLMHSHDTAAAIARALGVSVNTVRKQLASIYAKLDVHDRTSAILVAEQMGFSGRRRSANMSSCRL